MMKISMACDHGGLALKEHLKAHLLERGFEVVDFGTNSTDSCDYPDYARPAAEAVASGECDRGILVCTTGIGVSITANKVKGIRCALCNDVYSAKKAREHNNANVLAMGGRVLGFGPAGEIVRAFVESSFEGGRHARRVNKIMAIEQQ